MSAVLDQMKAALLDAPDLTEALRAEGAGEGWPEPQPLPSALPAVAPFDPALLPEAFRPWIEDIAERIQCPPDFPAVAVMVGLAAVVGRQVGIRPKRRDNWLVVPNLWGAVVGRPGVMKTPSMTEPMHPLRKLEAAARSAHEAERREWEIGQMVAGEAKKVAADAIRKAIKAGGDARSLAAEALAGEDGEPQRQRYIVNDSSVEKLGELLAATPRGLLVFRDELVGFLRSLDREGQDSARAFYLEAWNGAGRFTYDRIGRGTVEIEAACVSILGGIQPGPLEAYMRTALRGGAGDDGLIQRFQLLVWPDIRGEWRNVDRWPDSHARNRAFDVFERLDRLEPADLQAEREDGEPIPFLRFAAEAQELFGEWRGEIEQRLRAGSEHPAFEAHLSKYRSLIPSLALLIHLADAGSGPVSEAALLRACAWGEYLESHARRLYAPGLAPDAALGQTLAERIVRGQLADEFQPRDVYRKGWVGLGTPEDVLRALHYLADLDWLAVETVPTAGAPKTVATINPKARRASR